MKGNWFVMKLKNGDRVRGRMQMERYCKDIQYRFKVELFWNKQPDHAYDEDMTEKIEEQLMLVMEMDETAFLVMVTEDDTQYIFTWYTSSLQTFGERMNQCLSGFPQLPISVFSMEDPGWERYVETLKMVDGMKA